MEVLMKILAFLDRVAGRMNEALIVAAVCLAIIDVAVWAVQHASHMIVTTHQRAYGSPATRMADSSLSQLHGRPASAAYFTVP
jgi:hypothetical protein